MYLTENYNSPQSVYWCLKSLVVIGLAKDHSFWKEEETPYPNLDAIPDVKLLRAPRQILCNGNHHFMLSACQFIGIPFKAVAAKYGKFAYSSAFGFSVPSGQANLEQIAPDNALVLSKDGMQTWALKYKSDDAEFATATLITNGVEEGVDTLRVRWCPWFERTLEISTTIIPPTSRWPDWHVRIHRLKVCHRNIARLFTAEGGFAIHGRRKKNGEALPEIPVTLLDGVTEVSDVEGIVQGKDSTLILSHAGASGVVTEILGSSRGEVRHVSAFKPDPNTNLVNPRTVIPLVEHEFIDGLKVGEEVLLMMMVFAIPSDPGIATLHGRGDIREVWEDRPQVTVDGFDRPSASSCIRLQM